MGFAKKREQVVFADRVKRDVTDDDDFIVINSEVFLNVIGRILR